MSQLLGLVSYTNAWQRVGVTNGRGRSPCVENGAEQFADRVAQLVLEYLIDLAI